MDEPLETNSFETNSFETIVHSNKTPIKAWTQGVVFDVAAQKQLLNIASLDFIHSHIAVMPDVHLGKGATIGSVIPCLKAVIPAAVGVDIGCGMVASQTSLTACDLPDNLKPLRHAFEQAVPHGSHQKNKQVGAWQDLPKQVIQQWASLNTRFQHICAKHPVIEQSNHIHHLGTLGGGNHFLELCLDENDQVWIMLHSGSRGVGNRIGRYFIELAKKDMEKHAIALPDKDLSYLKEGAQHFDDYIQAVDWAQDFAAKNRQVMMTHAIGALKKSLGREFSVSPQAVNCHHNYVAKEMHFGQACYVTRKGALRARKGDMGIIPGSMGACSYIVRGKGNPQSFHSCSHGAGRLLSRTQAKKRYSVADQIAATHGIECRKDDSVIDEIPHAYKNIDQVMKAQADLVEIVHTLRQVVCVKG